METDWNALAQEYHLRGMPPTDAFGFAKVLSLVGNLKGKLVLDYGCGTGKFSKILARETGSVIGIDSSEVMVKMAWRNNTSDFFLPLHTDSLMPLHTNLLMKTAAFDVAVSTFVYCTIPSQEELARVTQQIYSSLKPRGTFTLLDPHPDSLEHHFTSFYRRRPDNLFSGCPIEVKLEGLKEPIIDYWRSKEDYVEILTKEGFFIEKISEPVLNDVPSQLYFLENAVLLGEETKYPPYIIIHARKP
jgi:SAM-dependent methyltransferase